MMGLNINHLHIKVSDPQKTAKWLVDHLGARIVSETQSGEAVGFRINLQGLSLNVTQFVKGQKLEQHYGIEHLGLDTDDYPGVMTALKATGVTILEEKQLRDGRFVCLFEGPGGLRFELLESKDQHTPIR